MVLLGELDELALAHIVTKPKPLLAHARADLDILSQREVEMTGDLNVYSMHILYPFDSIT